MTALETATFLNSLLKVVNEITKSEKSVKEFCERAVKDGNFAVADPVHLSGSVYLVTVGIEMLHDLLDQATIEIEVQD